VSVQLTPFTLFQYLSKEVRVIQDEKGEPWWVAKDVCDILGIDNVSMALSRLDEDEVNLTDITDSLRRIQKTSIINEPGLYSLILSSKKPEAKPFKRWITHKVLPSIRKTGSYQISQDINTLTRPAKVTFAFLAREYTSVRGVTLVFFAVSSENVGIEAKTFRFDLACSWR